MRFRFLSLPAALVLSACAQPTMLGNLNDCDGRTAPDPNAAFTNMSHGLASLGVIVTYEHIAGPVLVKNCARSQAAPGLHDPSKVGGAPGPGIAETASARPCPASRA